MGKRHNKSKYDMESLEVYSSDDMGDACCSGSFNIVLHSMLCEKVPFDDEAFDLELGDEDEDGFTTVPSKGKKTPKKAEPPKKSGVKKNPGNRLIPKREDYRIEDVERFTTIFKNVHYGMTGRKLKGFKLTPATHKYVTMMVHGRKRDQILATLFDSRPTCWDLYSGSGADAISFMEDLNPQEVVCCNKSVPEGVTYGPAFEQSEKEFEVLKNNINSFWEAYPELRGDPANNWLRKDGQTQTKVKLKHMHAHTYIRSCAEGTEVDMIYLDPSWDDELKDERKFEMQPKELFDNLEENIWGPIREKKIKVGVYVIKTRWNWLRVQEYLPKVNSEYLAMYSVRAQPFRTKLDEFGKFGEVKGLYHFMILVHRQYKTVNAPNGQLYWDIVRNGIPVWVKRDTVIKIHKPEYSNQLSTPEFTETDPHNEAEYFKVEPPPFPHDMKRYVEDDKKKKNASYNPEYFKVVPEKSAKAKEAKRETVEKKKEPKRDVPAPPNRYTVLPDDDTGRALKARSN